MTDFPKSTVPGAPDLIGTASGSGSERPPVGEWRSTFQARVLRILLASAVVVFAFPGPAVSPAPTLDGAWVSEINRVAAGPGFGRDVAFTYGPLGYLLHPMDVGHHVWAAALFRVLFALAFGVLAYQRLATAGWIRSALFLAAQVLAVALGLIFEYQVLIVFLLAVCAVDAPRSRAVPAVLGVCAAAAVFVKISLGVALLTITGVPLAISALRDRRGSWMAFTSWIASAVAAFIVLPAWFLRSWSDLLPWLRTSLQITAGFPGAMAIIGPTPEVAVATAVLVGWAIASAALVWRRSPCANAIAGAALAAFVAFKHAFVRQDAGHVILFFPLLLAVLGVAITFAASRRIAVAIGIAMALVASLACWVDTVPHLPDDGPSITPDQIAERVTGQAGATALVRWLTPSAHLEDYGVERLAAQHVQGLREFVGTRSIAVLPNEASVCVANGLACVPNVTLQAYAAYTADLDAHSARMYSGPEAPDLVLFRWNTIDYRHVALDTPLLWRTLVQNYRAVAPVGGFVLLQRRSNPTPVHERAFAESRGSFRAAIPVLAAPGGKTAVRIALSLTARGKATQSMLRSPPVYLSFKHASGRESIYRVPPETLRNGIPISDFAEPDELTGVLADVPARDPVIAFALTGPGVDDFREPVQLTWTQQE